MLISFQVIEHIAHSKRLEEHLCEIQQKLQQCQQKCDKFDLENKRLMREIKEEKEYHNDAQDQLSNRQIELKNLKDNYERLKYACTVTDNQLTEVEAMLEKEQQCNKTYQEKIERLNTLLHEKDKLESELKASVREEQRTKQAAESRIIALCKEIQEQRSSMNEMQIKLADQQQHIIEQTTSLFSTQEKVEVLNNENQSIQVLNENLEGELNLLKEENARILSDLFHAKEETQRLQQSLNDSMASNTELQGEIQDFKRILEEKENFYLQRDIKSEATLVQHKKLIDYLQLKVEDLTQKKKKTLADKIFGHSSSSGTNKKENSTSFNVENSILYRTLQEELKREKLRCKTLQEQLEKIHEKNATSQRSPLKSKENQMENSTGVKDVKKSPHKQCNLHKNVSGSPNKSRSETSTSALAKYTQSHHRFELALQEVNSNVNCCACDGPVIAGSPFWKCRECKDAVHRKCRGLVKESCGGVGAIISNKTIQQISHNIEANTLEPSAPQESELDSDSLGKYSYEAKLDEPDSDISSDRLSSALIFTLTPNQSSEGTIEVACAYEIEDNKILLLGCNTGLYALHIQTQNLVHIAGIDAVSSIAISQPLAKAIMVGSQGESLYQCDLRHLQSRCQSIACLNPALEASVLELPFANRTSSEKWQLVQISQESEQPLDTVAIAATSSRIVILKYDIKQQKFKPVRALDTATAVTSIFYTRHTAIVTSDKFFEIDLSTYGAEEFIDVSDKSLSHTRNYTPVSALRISKQEFLLCFMENGVFVDEYGCRSRPYDLNWEYTPCGFLYRAPFLYVAHFQSIQIIRLHRSYTQEMASIPPKDADADTDDYKLPHLKRSYLPFYMPSILSESGKIDAFILATQKNTGTQEIHVLHALQAFRQQHSDSLETISSIGTSVTLGSLSTAN